MALASFEGKYPKDLFHKSVYTDDNQAPLGYVAKETDDVIVVFSESDKKVRFDIPKSEIAVAGGSIIIQNSQSVLSRYKMKRSAPLPADKNSMAAPGEPEIDVQELDRLKEAKPHTDKGREKIKTTSVTSPSLEIVESSNRVIATDSKAIEAKKPSIKNTDSASPVKFSSAVVTLTPKEDNETTNNATQAISTIPLVLDSPQSAETTNTDDEEMEEASPSTTNVADPGTTSSNYKKTVSTEALSVVREEEEIQQVTSELEYVAEANAVNKLEPSSPILEESPPYSSNDSSTKSDEEGQQMSRDETNLVVVESDTPITDADYYPKSMTGWHAWIDAYNAFTTHAVRSSLNWFDLFWKLWTPTKPSAPKTDDNNNE
jgi:hypothetical protein